MRLRLEHGRRDDLKTLHPAYFALVMATGIVSIATYLHRIPLLPTVLFWLNASFLVAYNLTRVMNIMGIQPLMAAMRA
jgi:hypothetical protein